MTSYDQITVPSARLVRMKIMLANNVMPFLSQMLLSKKETLKERIFLEIQPSGGYIIDFRSHMRTQPERALYELSNALFLCAAPLLVSE